MKFKTVFFLYLFLLLGLVIFSYGLVDPNLELGPSLLGQIFQKPFSFLAFQKPLRSTLIFTFFILTLFAFYFYFLSLPKFSEKEWRKLILAVVFILFFSYPAFSHDIFNYIMTAKVVTFYGENPYLIMPIEFLGEPMLAFMHLANKTTPYGPFWIGLTLIPSFLAKANILRSISLFKALMVIFYLGSLWLINQILKKNNLKKRLKGIVFFAFNPLVLIEVLISSHNDIVMMFFALLGLYLLFYKKKLLALISLLVSGGIKYVTLALLPLFLLFPRIKKEKLISLAYWLLLFIFILSPLKRELHPWYLIWILPLAALVPENKFFSWLAIAFSLGLLGRYLPFLYTRSWEGVTLIFKRWVTILPPLVVVLAFSLRKAFKK